jgi:transcriptional regulator GlxA family with amidase domain
MEHADRSLSGGTSLDVVARRSAMTMRTLQRRFHREVGLSPKIYQRVVRFRRAFRMLSEAGGGSWAQVAVRNGYYDQAHLIRDFSHFAGASPRSFFGSSHTLAQAFSTANHGGTETMETYL